MSDFYSIIFDAQRNELEAEERRRQEERRQAAELRRQANPKTINATELLGYKSEEDIAKELGEELDRDAKEAREAAAKYEKEEDHVSESGFPPPVITTK